MTRAAAALAVLAFTLPARPDVPLPAAGGVSRLDVNAARTAAVSAAALALWGAGEVADAKLAPERCRWCEPGGLDRDVRTALRWGDPHAAARASDVLLFALPASLTVADYFLAGRDLRRAGEDLLVVTESAAVAGLATAVLKLSVGRRRPDAWAAGRHAGAEDEVSFPSGHTSIAFATASAFGQVARLRGYGGWPVVLAAGYAGSAAVSYLRMAGDKHWITDCAAGAAVGILAGTALPLLLHQGTVGARALTVAPYPLGFAGTF